MAGGGAWLGVVLAVRGRGRVVLVARRGMRGKVVLVARMRGKVVSGENLGGQHSAMAECRTSATRLGRGARVITHASEARRSCCWRTPPPTTTTPMADKAKAKVMTKRSAKKASARRSRRGGRGYVPMGFPEEQRVVGAEWTIARESNYLPDPTQPC